MRAILNPFRNVRVWLTAASLLSLVPSIGHAGNTENRRAIEESDYSVRRMTPVTYQDTPMPEAVAPMPLQPIQPAPMETPVVPPLTPMCAPPCAENTECFEDRPGLFCGELGDPWTLKARCAERRCMDPDDMKINFGGWFQFGYTNNSDGVFNTVPDRFNLHQGWFFAEKVADGSDGVGWGFRADIMYGIDANNTQAFGNNPGTFDFVNGWDHGVYGWAMPQLYGEMAINDTSVKIGHFYTPMGYEVVTAPGNFFFSHAYTMNFSEAFTHTGVLATTPLGENFKAYYGWTLGWDTGFAQNNGGSNFLGGGSWTVNDELTVTYMTTIGNLGWIGDGYAHTIVADKKFNDKWEYIFQSDVLHTNAGVFGGTTYHTVGINNYLFYTVNERVKLGGRAEWWKANGVSYNEITAGVNYRPHANVVLRPEIRYQWSPAAANPIGLPEDATIFGIDMIITY